jgi:glc operon protein GlcG
MIRKAVLLASMLLATPALAAPAPAGGAAEPALATPPTLSSASAFRLLTLADQLGRQRGYANCIAIDDANGNLLAFVRRGNTAPGCVEAAMAKARSAASNGVDTRVFYDLAKDKNVALGFIPGILPAVAGVIITHKGAVIGSVGIAGGPSDAEEEKFAAELRDQMLSWLP